MGATKTSAALRSDPTPRPTDGQSGRFSLVNKDPDRHYQWIEKGGDWGPDYYESIGYRIETYTGKDGVRPLFGKANRGVGDTFESSGLILVSVDHERWEEIQKFGPDGETGQALIDKREGRIKDRGALRSDVFDGMSGIGGRSGRYMDVENDTKDLEPGVR